MTAVRAVRYVEMDFLASRCGLCLGRMDPRMIATVLPSYAGLFLAVHDECVAEWRAGRWQPPWMEPEVLPHPPDAPP